MSNSQWIESYLQRVTKDYQDLNSSTVDFVDQIPSSVEFSRFVASNRPLIIRGRQKHQLALKKWSNDYLLQSMGENLVEIGVSRGNADSVVNDPSLGAVFVEPATERMTMDAFFGLLLEAQRRNDSDSDHSDPPSPVYYLQSQNGNLLSELKFLAKDIEVPEFTKEAFGKEPELPNVWIGDASSVSSTHKDPFENIYLVVRGTKTFYLQPPTEFFTLHEKRYPHAKYCYNVDTKDLTIDKIPDSSVPWIPVDPSAPDLVLYPRFKYARPLIATLEAGDMLYLPALWYHRVSQDVGPDTIGGGELKLAIAVNWWTEMNLDGPLQSLATLLRRMTLQLDGVTENDSDDDDSV